jgi:hypothetical protein
VGAISPTRLDAISVNRIDAIGLKSVGAARTDERQEDPVSIVDL